MIVRIQPMTLGGSRSASNANLDWVQEMSSKSKSTANGASPPPATSRPVTVPDFLAAKARGERLTC